MDQNLPEVCAVLRHLRACLIAAGFSVAGAGFGLLWLANGESNTPQSAEFPLEVVRDQPAIVSARRAIPGKPMLEIRRVSADRKWIPVEVRHGLYFFDVQQRRFVARMASQSAMLWSWRQPDGWTSSCMIGMVHRNGRSPLASVVHDIHPRLFSPRWEQDFYRLNFPARTARLLMTHKVRDGSSSEVGDIVPNRGCTHLAYCTQRYMNEPQHFICDLKAGTRQAILQRQFGPLQGRWPLIWIAGWLPDDRTVVFNVGRLFAGFHGEGHRVERLHLVDAPGKQAPRQVPILAKFLELREKGQLARDEGAFVASEILGFVDEGRRCRFSATFLRANQTGGASRPTTGPIDPRSDNSSIWDLDLESGELQRVLDLKWGIYREGIIRDRGIVCSPERRSFVAALASGASHSSGPTFRTQAAIYTVGRPPRLLPFEVSRTASRPNVQFLDEDTLIYETDPCALWRFDLRTSESELLWRPGRR